MQQPLDVVSWDSYPRFHNDEESFSDTMTENAFDHAMIRCLKKEQPFMLMESAPGLVNWHPFNKMKRPAYTGWLRCRQWLSVPIRCSISSGGKEGDRLSSTMGRLWIISERMIPEFFVKWQILGKN